MCLGSKKGWETLGLEDSIRILNNNKSDSGNDMTQCYTQGISISHVHYLFFIL